MNPRIVVISPGGVVTGGVEALHQLVHVANTIEPGSAAICHWPFSANFKNPVQYEKYSNPQIRCGEIPTSALVVLPEIYPNLAHVLPNRCALWWLSVDNFGAHGQFDISKIVLHLCQSHYAWNHTADFGKRLMLTDWVEVQEVSCERSARVVVNPAKDAGLMRPALAGAPFEVAYLSGLNSNEAARLLRSSSIYVEFGHHPGRDRIPREAAIAGCAVLTTRHGAARFFEDMPIPDWAFFSSVGELWKKIEQIHSGEVDAVRYQNDYQRWVRGNRAVFEVEVQSLLRAI